MDENNKKIKQERILLAMEGRFVDTKTRGIAKAVSMAKAYNKHQAVSDEEMSNLMNILDPIAALAAPLIPATPAAPVNPIAKPVAGSAPVATNTPVQPAVKPAAQPVSPAKSVQSAPATSVKAQPVAAPAPAVAPVAPKKEPVVTAVPQNIPMPPANSASAQPKPAQPVVKPAQPVVQPAAQPKPAQPAAPKITSVAVNPVSTPVNSVKVETMSKNLIQPTNRPVQPVGHLVQLVNRPVQPVSQITSVEEAVGAKPKMSVEQMIMNKTADAKHLVLDSEIGDDDIVRNRAKAAEKITNKPQEEKKSGPSKVSIGADLGIVKADEKPVQPKPYSVLREVPRPMVLRPGMPVRPIIKPGTRPRNTSAVDNSVRTPRPAAPVARQRKRVVSHVAEKEAPKKVVRKKIKVKKSDIVLDVPRGEMQWKKNMAVLLVLFAMVFAIFMVKFAYFDVKDKTVIETNQPKVSTEEKVELSDWQKNLEGHYSENKDFVGMLTIGELNTPVVHTDKESSDFYLDHDFNGNENAEGTVFVDKYNAMGDDVLVMFGHESKLGELLKYEDNEFYNNHKTIVFEFIGAETDNHKYEKNEYEVVAAYKNKDYINGEVSSTKNFYGSNEAKTWENYHGIIKESALYETEALKNVFNVGDKFITLSAVEDGGAGRFTIIAKLIK